MASETRREPANDFERWLADSRTLPDEREPAELCKGIAAAIGSREFAGAVALLTVLALRDPQKAEQIHDMVLAACGGHEPRAILLAALAGKEPGDD